MKASSANLALVGAIVAAFGAGHNAPLHGVRGSELPKPQPTPADAAGRIAAAEAKRQRRAARNRAREGGK